MDSFDLIVIGSGSGLEVSPSAAERGLSVAVVEKGPFGGTCLNRGCIPSKTLIYSANVMETIPRAERCGIKAQVSGVDWDFIVKPAVTTVLVLTGQLPTHQTRDLKRIRGGGSGVSGLGESASKPCAAGATNRRGRRS